MAANAKEPAYNFKINGYRNNVFFLLGSLFQRGWGDSFKISEFECWYQQTWSSLYSETC